MLRQLLRLFAVTAAFAVGAATIEILLQLQAVTVLLGLPAALGMTLRGFAEFVGIAILAGLIVDGLRFSAAHWWERNRQLEEDLEGIFTSNLT